MSTEAVIDQPIVKQPWGCLVSMNPKYPSLELYDDEVFCGRKNPDMKIDVSTISSKHFSIKRLTKNDVPLTLVTDLSTNGTFINGILMSPKQKLITSDWEISMLNPKTSLHHITYRFQDLSPEEQDERKNGPYAQYKLGSLRFHHIVLTRCPHRGSYGCVYECTENATGNQYAMKILEKNRAPISIRPEAFKDEVKILQSLDCEYITKLKDVFETERKLYIIIEFAKDGDLFNKICNKPLPEPTAREIIRQLLCTIAYLHKHKITHRDIKPENILIEDFSKPHIKLSDFGLSRHFRDSSFMGTKCGSLDYAAPEVLHSACGYTSSVDMWSLGMTTYATLFSSLPTNNEISFPKTPTISDEAKDFISQLCVIDPEKRLSDDEALNHPWFKIDLSERTEEEKASDNSPTTYLHSNTDISMTTVAGKRSRDDFTYAEQIEKRARHE